jgi:hypothetical protein
VLLTLIGLRLARPTSAAGLFVGANLHVLLLFVGLFAAGVFFVLFSFRSGPSALLVCLLLATLLLTWNRWLGLQIAISDDGGSDYLQLCRWARQNTPVDAVFVVPPNEQLFRYHAQRAIVVNFKNVPQLSSEMTEWRARLEAVLDEPLLALPRRFDLAHAAIAARYDALPPAHLAAVAQRYGARYIVTAHPAPGMRPVFENATYHLYDLSR